MAKGFTEHKDMHSLFIFKLFPMIHGKDEKVVWCAFQKMDCQQAFHFFKMHWDNKRKRYAL
jgi:hypothetical protein